jgi:hypothetical protein
MFIVCDNKTGIKSRAMKVIINILILQICIVPISVSIAHSQRVLNNRDSLVLEEAFVKNDISGAKTVLENWVKESRNKKSVIHSDDERLVYNVYRKFMNNFLSGKLEGFNSFYLTHAHYIFLQPTMNYCISQIFTDSNICEHINKLIDAENNKLNGLTFHKLVSFLDSIYGYKLENYSIYPFYPRLSNNSLKNDNGEERAPIFYGKEKERKCITDFLGFTREKGYTMTNGSKSKSMRERISFLNSIIGVDVFKNGDKNMMIEYGRPYVEKIIFDSERKSAMVIYTLNEATFWTIYSIKDIEEQNYVPRSILISVV